ncbi:MAG: nucleotidyltransferase [Paeniclostridium sordellii]|uniref:tRNA(Met) cytidine acetate ligase n=1 Tax=Paeniclostridium hominis TaxID=2764329 RepID=A0ABR7K4J2_9FIRM|nr:MULTISPECIES: nucleotidyltransferase [Paeniclostridium]MBC6003951.1 nucleotidyltransferase [Paeniclostridium hominis]MDU2591524.1 nucleotidyltransferase [Paeniclostridium sordellii]
MKILGLIVEYNPFHNGHLYHLKKSLEITNSTHSIAVMSGNFLQRGEPALFDKYKRAEMAVSNGVDLVVELPTLYACQSAEIFAHGAITLLNSLNCIDSICFGSEHGDIDLLVEISKILINEPDKFKTLLKRNLDEGILFALARSKALSEYMLNHTNLNIYENKLNDVLSTPNNILGIEYIKSLLKHKSTIRPYSITRIQADYNSETIESNICSATAIRKTLKEYNTLDSISNVVPIKTFELISKSIDNNFNPMFDEYYFDTIRELVIRDLNILNSYFDVNEGIENKIYKSVFSCKNIFELQQSIKSKRYTLTKVKRILNNILLGITKDDMNTVKNIMKLPYVRILAFNDKGREIIKQIKLNSEIKIINKFSNVNFEDDKVFETLIKYDIKATNMYNIPYYKNNMNLLKGPMDYYLSPVYIK